MMKQFFLLFFLCVSFSQVNAQLVYRNVLSGAVKIKLPVDFKLTEEKEKQEKYANPDSTVKLDFSISTLPLSEEDVAFVGQQLEQQLDATSGYQKIASASITSNGSNIYLYAFLSNGDTPLYNLKFIFSIKGKMVTGSFTCAMSLKEQWESIVDEIIRSIKVKTR